MREMRGAGPEEATLRDRPAGTVRLQASRSASAVLVEPRLGRFFEAYPDIILDLTIDDAVTNIVASGFDVSIRIGELLEQDMVAVKIGDDIRQLAVASPDYVARNGDP